MYQRFYVFSIMKKTIDIETTMTITITIGTATGSGQYGTYLADVDRKKQRQLKGGLLPACKSRQEPHEQFR